MELQGILKADEMTYLLFLGGIIILACIMLFWIKNRTKQLANSESSIQMMGLYYQLESGGNLFICKASRDEARMITNVVTALTKHSDEATDVLDTNAFHKVCSEFFDPTKLHTELISSTTNIYPMYRNTGILISGPNAVN